MIITWHGLNCFRLQTKDSTLVIDPFDQSTGIKLPIPSKFTADIVVSTHNGNNSRYLKAVGGEPIVITTPGEYEIKNTFVYGQPIAEGKGNGFIFKIEAENITIGCIGSLAKPLENGEVALLENSDILLLPVGGDDVLDYKMAVKMVSEIEPRIVIPCMYNIKHLKNKLDSLDKFLQEFGVKNPETLDKYKISRKELPQDEVKVVVLEPVN